MTPQEAALQPLVRFDSLDPARGRRSFRFERFRGLREAWRIDDVESTLKSVEAEVLSGHHAAGFICYEAGPAFDPALQSHSPSGDLPLVWFAIFGDRLEESPEAAPEGSEEYRVGPLRHSVSPERYQRDVRTILDLIAAGDTYQVNHTFRLAGEFTGSEGAFYRDLRLAQRSAYCASIRTARFSIHSASPELFFHLRGREIQLRPMKGTRPRGRWSEEDDALAEDLRESPKDRAENLMIVDLLRNDVGRVAEFGSVRVPTLFEVERYPTVHQMTSSVTATLREDADIVDVFRALFPSGSVTGAPKIRTSEIIRDLEDGPREIYTGAIGFISPGESVFSVAIRTVVLKHAPGTLELGVGSGITADSDAAEEYRECLGKGAFLRHRPPSFRLLESMRLEKGGSGLPLLEAHLNRLTRSAAYFGFHIDRSVLVAALERATADLETGVYKVRLLLDRQGDAEVEWEAIPAVSPPVRVALATEPIDEREVLLFHKTTAREIYRSRLALRPDRDDVILINSRGELTESTTANLVLEIGGERLTPPVESGLLPGVLRGKLLEAGEIATRVLTPADLAEAERVYLINSVRGWREATLEGVQDSLPNMSRWESVLE
jgi:para-aminobenzoate synthetase / 4-amino-4-deoxychorismate lyase